MKRKTKVIIITSILLVIIGLSTAFILFNKHHKQDLVDKTNSSELDNNSNNKDDLINDLEKPSGDDTDLNLDKDLDTNNADDSIDKNKDTNSNSNNKTNSSGSNSSTNSTSNSNGTNSNKGTNTTNDKSPSKNNDSNSTNTTDVPNKTDSSVNTNTQEKYYTSWGVEVGYPKYKTYDDCYSAGDTLRNTIRDDDGFDIVYSFTCDEVYDSKKSSRTLIGYDIYELSCIEYSSHDINDPNRTQNIYDCSNYLK